MKTSLLLPLVLVLFATTAAQAWITYTTNNSTITITGYAGPSGDSITILESI